MKKVLAIIAGGFSLFVLVAAIMAFTADPEKDMKVVNYLESEVVPFINENQVTFFFNMDWCRALRVGDKLFSRTVDSTIEEDCGFRLTGEHGNSFTKQDRDFFNQVEQVLASGPFEKFRKMSDEYPLTYRSEHADLNRESIGLGFHIECFFCRTRYVYSPGYVLLPPDIDLEIHYIPINENWYRVEQDWN